MISIGTHRPSDGWCYRGCHIESNCFKLKHRNNAHVALTEKLVGKTKWNFSEVLQFIREQMGIRTNGTLGPDSLTLKLKMEPHLFASVLYENYSL